MNEEQIRAFFDTEFDRESFYPGTGNDNAEHVVTKDIMQEIVIRFIELTRPPAA